MSDTTSTGKADNLLTLTVVGDRIVSGAEHGQTFTVDMGDPDTDARAEAERRVRSWVTGGHVADPALVGRKRKRKPASKKDDT